MVVHVWRVDPQKVFHVHPGRVKGESFKGTHHFRLRVWRENGSRVQCVGRVLSHICDHFGKHFGWPLWLLHSLDKGDDQVFLSLKGAHVADISCCNVPIFENVELHFLQKQKMEVRWVRVEINGRQVFPLPPPQPLAPTHPIETREEALVKWTEMLLKMLTLKMNKEKVPVVLMSNEHAYYRRLRSHGETRACAEVDSTSSAILHAVLDVFEKQRTDEVLAFYGVVLRLGITKDVRQVLTGYVARQRMDLATARFQETSAFLERRHKLPAQADVHRTVTRGGGGGAE